MVSFYTQFSSENSPVCLHTYRLRIVLSKIESYHNTCFVLSDRVMECMPHIVERDISKTCFSRYSESNDEQLLSSIFEWQIDMASVQILNITR